MIKEPNGILIEWNGRQYQIYKHNDTEEVVIYEIGYGVFSVYEKRKYKGRVFEAFIPSFQNEGNISYIQDEELPEPPPPDMKG